MVLGSLDRGRYSKQLAFFEFVDSMLHLIKISTFSELGTILRFHKTCQPFKFLEISPIFFISPPPSPPFSTPQLSSYSFLALFQLIKFHQQVSSISFLLLPLTFSWLVAVELWDFVGTSRENGQNSTKGK